VVPEARAEPRAAERPLRILVAEDNVVNQRVALLMLGRLGYRADVVANGAEALQTLGRTPYDVVLMDVQMPQMDGLEATRRLRAELPDQRQPWVVAMTASALAEDRERCLAAGMDDYLAKPIRRDELAAALEHVTRRVVQDLQEVPAPRTAAEGAAQKPPVVGHEVLDLQVLRGLAARLGDRGADLVAELVQTWTTESADRLVELSAAVRTGNRSSVSRVAHSLRGSSSALGAVAVERLCEDLERCLRSGAEVDLRRAETHLERAVADAARELQVLTVPLPG
jgi:CheY-like chemotaxis protein/HPt (histidine-containing phosphotransfer) domain-containing protein